MNTIIAVHTGEIKASKKDIIFKSSAIGSCIAIAAYDAKEKVGALAHTMLPGKAPAGERYQKKKYAADAIEEIISRMNLMGQRKKILKYALRVELIFLKEKMIQSVWIILLLLSKFSKKKNKDTSKICGRYRKKKSYVRCR